MNLSSGTPYRSRHQFECEGRSRISTKASFSRPNLALKPVREEESDTSSESSMSHCLWERQTEVKRAKVRELLKT